MDAGSFTLLYSPAPVHISHMRAALSALFLATIAAVVPASAASFDCSKARISDERAVCASRNLSEMDVEMAVRFETLSGLVAMGERGNMGDAQLDFLAARKHCGGDTSCIAQLYHRRIVVLKNQYRSLQQRGPF